MTVRELTENRMTRHVKLITLDCLYGSLGDHLNHQSSGYVAGNLFNQTTVQANSREHYGGFADDVSRPVQCWT